MTAIGAGVKKSLIFVHRWMGVAFCLLFCLWFSSGIFMMYWDYPAVSPADILRHEPRLDASRIRLLPSEAFARLGSNAPPDEILIGSFDGRPVYKFRFGDGGAILYADTGVGQDDFPPDLTLRIAAAWTGQPATAAQVEDNAPIDQWTVSEEFDGLRPLRKYSWPDGEQVYVSALSGDVVQYTTRASRLGAYFGAIPHWLYFTPLRRRGQVWSRVIIWASGLGTILAILGIIIGAWTLSPSKRYKRARAAAALPYVGSKRWHAILGLVFGPLACTWAFSGMLSMDPFPQSQSFHSGSTAVRLEQSLIGNPPGLSIFNARPPSLAIAAASGSDFVVKELSLASFAGEPVYLATAAPNQTRIVPIEGPPREEFDRDKIIQTIQAAAQPAGVTEVRTVDQYESYYLDRHHALPLPVLFFRIADKNSSIFYIDPKTAQIVQAYDAYSRKNRWLYHGLHSLNFAFLYNHRPAWDILALTLLIGGVSLSITSLLLAWGVLSRK